MKTNTQPGPLSSPTLMGYQKNKFTSWALIIPGLLWGLPKKLNLHPGPLSSLGSYGGFRKKKLNLHPEMGVRQKQKNANAPNYFLDMVGCA